MRGTSQTFPSTTQKGEGGLDMEWNLEKMYQHRPVMVSVKEPNVITGYYVGSSELGLKWVFDPDAAAGKAGT
jgi:hypothetical protein